MQVDEASSSLTPAMERMSVPEMQKFPGPSLWSEKTEKSSGAREGGVTAPMLRSMVEDALAKQMHGTAVFLAERLIHLGMANTADIVLFARCYFQGGEYRRCLAFLEHRGMLSAEMLGSLINIFVPQGSGEKENAGPDHPVNNSTSVFSAVTWMERICAVQLAANCLMALHEYDDCLVLLDPLILMDDARAQHAASAADTDHPPQGNVRGWVRTPTPAEDRMVERARGIFAAVSKSRSWTKPSSPRQQQMPNDDGSRCTINIIAGLYATAGRCYDLLDNRPRAIHAFTIALRIDAACTEVVDYIASRGLLGSEERARLFDLMQDQLAPTKRVSSAAAAVGPASERQWLLPYYQFMLGDGTPESAMRGLGRSTEEQLNDSVTSALAAADESRGSPIAADQANRGVDVPLGDGSAWLVRRAEYALDRQLTEDAYRLARAAYTIDPFDMRGLLVYITSMVELKLKTELFYLGHELVNTYPKQAVSWHAVGCYYWICQKYEGAQKYLQKATRLDRRMHTAWVALGHALAAQEESEHAISAYRAACRLVPGDHRPLCYLGKELIRTNNNSLGVHILQLSLTICATDPAVMNELGVALMRQDNLAEAEVHLRAAAHAIMYRGGHGYSVNGGGMMGHDASASAAGGASASVRFATAKDMHTAQDVSSHPSKRTRSRPKTPESGGELSVPSSGGSSQCTALQGNFLPDDPDATLLDGEDGEDGMGHDETQYRGRVAGIGGGDEIMSNYATCLRRLGRYDEALIWYERCLGLAPNCAATHAHIGFTLHLCARFDDAIDAYHRALTLQPNNVFCNDMLSRALTDVMSFKPFNLDEGI